MLLPLFDEVERLSIIYYQVIFEKGLMKRGKGLSLHLNRFI